MRALSHKLIPLWRLPFEIMNKMKLKGKTDLKVTMNIIMKLTMLEDNGVALATAKAIKMTPC
jgi:hypothetical protein